MSTTLETTLAVVPKKRSLMSEKYSFAKTAIILAFCSTIAALLLCIFTQGAPLIDLSNLVAP
jgi:hypothetical protein